MFTSGFKTIDKLGIDIEPNLIHTAKNFINLIKSISINQIKQKLTLICQITGKFDYSKNCKC
jgi:hypothetical protein